MGKRGGCCKSYIPAAFLCYIQGNDQKRLWSFLIYNRGI